jgi:arylsulfatase A-like enzyme
MKRALATGVRRWSVVGVLALAATAVWPLACTPRERPDIVLVVIDTLRRDELQVYGSSHETTPFVDSLARAGTTFAGISPSSWTKPAVVSLLTGLHPVQHQVIDRADRLPDEAVTLAERLHAVGYQTVAASANPWVVPGFGMARGFDTFLTTQRDGPDSAQELDRLLRQQVPRLRSPYFLYVHYFDPHLPYVPQVDRDGRALRFPRQSIDGGELQVPHEASRAPALVQRARWLYEGEVGQVDDGVRELVDWVRSHGRRRPIVIVTADHGEEFAEHGRMGHGQTLFREVVEVPLIFEGPGVGVARRGPASLLDVMPTVAQLAGVSTNVRRPLRLPGHSLVPALRGAAGTAEPPLLLHVDWQDGTGLALLADGQALILGQHPYRKLLFDVVADPAERRNLVGTPAGRRAFHRLASTAADLYNRFSRQRLPRASQPIASAELLHQLGALGYGMAAAARPRILPARLETADDRPDGRLGWAGEHKVACLAPGTDDRQLLEGWYDAEAGGRWNSGHSTVVVGWPDPGPPRELVIAGANFGPRPLTVQVRVADLPVAQRQVGAGGFTLDVPLPPKLPPAPWVVDLVASPTFVPAQSGSADQRRLGVFVTSLCVR